ncbi:MAG TPA: O-antigen polymerase [Terriglobales bacterium]|nr:O-antigen polymerase [Terriglobales bacterium]
MIPLSVLLASSVAGVYIARRLLGSWVNHLSIYSVTWGLSLSAYELGLIVYNPICTEAWLYIAVAWVSVFLGAALVVFSMRKQALGNVVMPDFNPSFLRITIWVLSLLTVVSLIQQIRQIQAEFGGLTEALVLNPNDVYVSRAAGELGGVPYLGFFELPAACLAGLYTARLRKLTFTALLPILVAAAASVISMQRAGLLIAAPLFVYAFIFSRTSRRIRLSKRWIATLAASSVVLFGAFLLIGSHRGSYMYHSGQTQELNNFAEYMSGLPSLYFYVSATGPTLSQYLLHPEVDTYSFFGSNTFAPVCRLLAKLGFRTSVPYYTPFYYVPQDGNQATYLAYIDADFGPAGIVIVPAILSGVLTFLSLRNNSQFRISRLMLYVNLLVAITFSFSGYYLGLTYWLTSFVTSALIGWWIDKTSEQQNQRSLPDAV